jgi:hypothetical protein
MKKALKTSLLDNYPLLIDPDLAKVPGAYARLRSGLKKVEDMNMMKMYSLNVLGWIGQMNSVDS